MDVYEWDDALELRENNSQMAWTLKQKNQAKNFVLYISSRDL